MQRVNQRQGFLVSAVIHLTLLMMLLNADLKPFEPTDLDPSELERRELVFLPRPEILRQLVPAPPLPQPVATPQPVPVPTPVPREEPPEEKERVSIGPPSPLRSEGPIILRPEDDLTQAARGLPELPRPTPPPQPAPTPPGEAGPKVAEKIDGLEERPGRPGLRLPPGLLGETRSGDDGQEGRTGREEQPAPAGSPGPTRPGTSLDRSVERAMDDAARRMSRDASLGLADGAAKNFPGFHFDPRGADFSVWMNHAKNQVYRNWVVPQAALLGYRGHVDFEMTLERDGSMSALRMLKSSGTSSLDRSARNSLTASRYMPLPGDYAPPRLTMQVIFNY